MTSYGYIENNKIIAPVAMCPRFKGVGAWHLLTDEQQAEYGWYPCVVIGEGYDTALQVLSELPECVFDYEAKIISVYNPVTWKGAIRCKVQYNHAHPLTNPLHNF